MTNKIIEAAELPEEEKVYLKKDMFGWRVVDPWRTPDGKINWFNLLTGGKKNLAVTIVLLVLFVLIYLGTQELISNYQMIADDPCAFCKDCQAQVRKVISGINKYEEPKLNFSEFNLSGGE